MTSEERALGRGVSWRRFVGFFSPPAFLLMSMFPRGLHDSDQQLSFKIATVMSSLKETDSLQCIGLSLTRTLSEAQKKVFPIIPSGLKVLGTYNSGLNLLQPYDLLALEAPLFQSPHK